ncbi:MAG: hypothetical protein MI723_14600 [Caulobacterales bacterium]|nr:hypothetical protein [Caulobacterales bacterium]
MNATELPTDVGGQRAHHTTWTAPNTDGLPDAQNAVVRRRFLADGADFAGKTFTYSDYPRYSEHIEDGAVVIKNAKSAYFEGNNFTRLGYIGFMTRDGVQNTYVVGNRFVDISGTAIQIGDAYSRADSSDFYPPDPKLIQKIMMSETTIYRISALNIDRVPASHGSIPKTWKFEMMRL